MWKKVLSKLKSGKSFNNYYLLVFTVIVLTIVIQSIIQYSLARQRQDALRINVAGRQRMLSQSIVKSVYECRYSTCDYGQLRLAMTKFSNANIALQEGNDATGIPVLDNDEIQKNFDKLKPHLNFILESTNDFNKLELIDLERLSAEADKFLVVMDTIVDQFQKGSEEDIKTLMIIELELAVFSLLILILEIFFFINPSIKKITIQNQKLKEIAWHQTHAFNSHMKNIKNYNHVLKIEKNVEHKEELISFLMEELTDLEGVSENMVKSLEKQT
ncbi:type IV pili methyl-accepting chemotaxis transducer N-terminal domain-containing protein [Maribacter sp. 1_MG-2023]|uniref:type IV pili methyl-accepting chemotaxis transducer N-terminal domain-containing protein n=1 Tax=Maribacter sp. 1_MG-2023 TaxID=3062677 RepID=UPI0026E183C6|nr:type IV pili methyl-accepting chemotaxis transducer N-terminal domain-containing protein [Maribacter sp. 1_MG-2023]MDO6471985.1 type IV pili methyl-accepting chemotaxis transducer N-terminal domain-containing protein [Maribacter sp. 1_MG-2023]